jgi:predicted PilT family ATPase
MSGISCTFAATGGSHQSRATNYGKQRVRHYLCAAASGMHAIRSWRSHVVRCLTRSKVGFVIGRGGEKIRELEERTGARLQLLQDGIAPHEKKPLHITGSPDAVLRARQVRFRAGTV